MHPQLSHQYRSDDWIIWTCQTFFCSSFVMEGMFAKCDVILGNYILSKRGATKIAGWVLGVWESGATIRSGVWPPTRVYEASEMTCKVPTWIIPSRSPNIRAKVSWSTGLTIILGWAWSGPSPSTLSCTSQWITSALRGTILSWPWVDTGTWSFIGAALRPLPDLDLTPCLYLK